MPNKQLNFIKKMINSKSCENKHNELVTVMKCIKFYNFNAGIIETIKKRMNVAL